MVDRLFSRKNPYVRFWLRVLFLEIHKIVVISSSKVPIIRVSSISGLEFDMSIRRKYSAAKDEMIRTYCLIDYRVSPFLFGV